MTPDADLELDEFEVDFSEEETPNLTYRLDFETKRIVGMVDDEDALAQALNKILLTEVDEYLIYSYGYGREFDDLYGMNTRDVSNELPQRISDGVLKDERFQSVDVTDLEVVGKRSIHVHIVATTADGAEIEVEEELNV